MYTPTQNPYKLSNPQKTNNTRHHELSPVLERVNVHDVKGVTRQHKAVALDNAARTVANNRPLQIGRHFCRCERKHSHTSAKQ